MFVLVVLLFNCLVLWGLWDMNWKILGQPVVGCHKGLDSIIRFLSSWNIAVLLWEYSIPAARTIYFMGIIDILTPYDEMKKFEHRFKACVILVCRWPFVLHFVDRWVVAGAKCLAIQLFRLCVMIGMVFRAALLHSMQVAFAASWRRQEHRRKCMQRWQVRTVSWFGHTESSSTILKKPGLPASRSLKLCTKNTNNNGDTFTGNRGAVV